MLPIGPSTTISDEVDRAGGVEAARDRRPSIQARLGRGFDPAELRRIKRLWVRHSIAEDRRDIDGLIATLAPTCEYEIVVTGQRWQGHDGARRFYTELFAAFPDNAFALVRDRRRAAGRLRGRDAHRHEPGAVGRRPAERPGRRARGPHPLPVGPRHGAVPRGARSGSTEAPSADRRSDRCRMVRLRWLATASIIAPDRAVQVTSTTDPAALGGPSRP